MTMPRLTPPRAGFLVTTLIAAGLVGLLALTAAIGRGVTTGSSDAPGIEVTALPGQGEIRFGSAVDPTSFALTPIGTEVRAGTTVAAVAHLARMTGPGALDIVVEVKGTELARQRALVDGPAGHDLVAWTFVPPVSGDLRVRILGEDDAVLAEGMLFVR